MSLACSYSIDAMNALVSSSSSRLSSSPKKTTNQYIPNHDPDSHFDESLKSYDTVDISNDSDIPPRPTSRLGFHDMGDSPSSKSRSSHSRSRSATLKWTRTLFQKMGFDSSSNTRSQTEPTQVLDTRATLVHDDEDLESSVRNIFPSLSRDNLSLDDISFTLSSGSDDDDDSDLSDSDFDLDSLSLSDLEDLREPCPSLPQTSITAIASSSFCTNPNTSASTSATPFSSHSTVSDEFEPSASIAKVPAIPEKYSSLPSPFSPSFTKSPRPVIPPNRHFYDNRGHSRHSLHHQKWFWGAREEAWAHYAAHVNSVGAYAGINTSPEQPIASRFPLLFSSARTTRPNSRRPWISESNVHGYPLCSQPELGVSAMDGSCSVPPATPSPSRPQPLSPTLVPLPPMTLHPRWGDFESLRDAWCVHMDRYFVGMPLWSIRKSLWMFDLHALEMVSGKLAMGTKLSSVSRCQPELDAHAHHDDGDDGVDDSTTDGGEEEECCSEDECGSMGMSMLTGLSDDSDITLVESDNESDGGDHEVEVETAAAGASGHVDAPVSGSSGADFDGEEEFFEDVDLNDYGLFNSVPSSSSSSSSLRSLTATTTIPMSSSSSSSSSLSHFAGQPQSFSLHFSSAVEHSPPQIHPSYTPLFLSSTWSSFSSCKYQNQNPNKHLKKNGSVIVPWETSWYKRSEVLLQLTRRDKELKVKVGELKNNKNKNGNRGKRRKSDCGLEEEDVGGKSSIESTSIGLGISVAMSMSINDEDDDPVTKALATSSHLKTVCAA